MTIPEQAVQAALETWPENGTPYDASAQMRAALTAAAPHLAAVRVKKLEWTNSDEKNNDEWLCSTETLPTYTILRWWLDDVRDEVGHFEVEGLGEDQFGTLEDAKAAAQADYAARILSALEPSAGDMGNPITDKTVKRRIADALEYVWSALDCDVEHIESIIAHMQGNGLRIVDTVKIDNTEVILEPSAGRAAVSSRDIVDALFKDLRDRRFLKWLFSERGDDCLIDVFRGGDELRGLDLEVQQEIRKAWEAIIESALHPVADKPDEAGAQGEGWLPIESAPTDKMLLLACTDWAPVQELGREVPVKVGYQSFGRWTIFGASWAPTHWRHLPTPPSSEVA